MKNLCSCSADHSWKLSLDLHIDSTRLNYENSRGLWDFPHVLCLSSQSEFSVSSQPVLSATSRSHVVVMRTCDYFFFHVLWFRTSNIQPFLLPSRLTGMPKEKYDPPDPRRCYTIMPAEEAANGKKSYWAELEISGQCNQLFSSSVKKCKVHEEPRHHVFSECGWF